MSLTEKIRSRANYVNNKLSNNLKKKHFFKKRKKHFLQQRFKSSLLTRTFNDGPLLSFGDLELFDEPLFDDLSSFTFGGFILRWCFNDGLVAGCDTNGVTLVGDLFIEITGIDGVIPAAAAAAAAAIAAFVLPLGRPRVGAGCVVPIGCFVVSVWIIKLAAVDSMWWSTVCNSDFSSSFFSRFDLRRREETF